MRTTSPARARRAGQGGEREVPGVAQLAVGGDQGLLGGRVLAHLGEAARHLAERLADGGGHDRRGDGPAAVAAEAGGAQQLGQPVDGEERHGGHAATAGQGPARGHADVVGGDDHGDRGQPVGRLRLAHERGEALEGRGPVGHGVDADSHGSAS